MHVSNTGDMETGPVPNKQKGKTKRLEPEWLAPKWLEPEWLEPEKA